MRTAIVISVAFHAALLAWAFGAFTTPQKFDVKPMQVTAVDIVKASDISRMKAGQRKASDKPKPARPVVKQTAKTPTNAANAPKPKAKPKTPKVKAVRRATAKPKPKPKVVKAKPKPKPKVVKPKVVKAKPKPKPKPKVAKAKPKPKPRPKLAKAQPKPQKAKPKPRRKPVSRTASKTPSRTPSRRARPAQRDFDAERIAALLNKLPDAPRPSGTNRPAPTPRRASAPAARPTYGRPSGRDATMSANEIDAFRAQVSECWNPPVGGLGASRMVVKLRIKFNKDGTLARAPALKNNSASPFFRAAAESAMRAVWQCQPYTMPVAKFDIWNDMVLNFDPRQMYGGY